MALIQTALASSFTSLSSHFFVVLEASDTMVLNIADLAKSHRPLCLAKAANENGLLPYGPYCICWQSKFDAFPSQYHRSGVFLLVFVPFGKIG